MSVRFRPYDPDRRLIWPVPFVVTGMHRGRWLSLHAAAPDWKALFIRALDLMLIPATDADRGGEASRSADRNDGILVIGNGLGRVRWRRRSAWTIIDLDLNGMSGKKQAVVKAALLKAARYAR
jgi:hypothetical protein